MWLQFLNPMRTFLLTQLTKNFNSWKNVVLLKNSKILLSHPSKNKNLNHLSNNNKSLLNHLKNLRIYWKISSKRDSKTFTSYQNGLENWVTWNTDVQMKIKNFSENAVWREFVTQLTNRSLKSYPKLPNMWKNTWKARLRLKSKNQRNNFKCLKTIKLFTKNTSVMAVMLILL